MMNKYITLENKDIVPIGFPNICKDKNNPAFGKDWTQEY